MAHGLGDSREAVEPGAKAVKFARSGEGQSNARRQALEVRQVLEGFSQVVQEFRAVDQLRHRTMTFTDFLEVDARTHQPVVQHS